MDPEVFAGRFWLEPGFATQAWRQARRDDKDATPGKKLCETAFRHWRRASAFGMTRFEQASSDALGHEKEGGAVTRLDVFIDRMVSQRASLDFAIGATAAMTGPVFELGLGNGRTYHHMRAKITGRDIFVFEREIAAQPNSRPDPGFAILGDVTQTLPAALARFGASVSLIHADLGGPDLARNDAFARLISPLAAPLLAPGGLMVSSDRMYFDDLVELPVPEGAVPGRCFVYQRPADQQSAGTR